MAIINLGDLVTLKGMTKSIDKPLGMVKRIWATKDIEIFWLNEELAKRYALTNIINPKKLEIVSKATRQSS
mgnify:CR=1 FL=1